MTVTLAQWPISDVVVTSARLIWIGTYGLSLHAWSEIELLLKHQRLFSQNFFSEWISEIEARLRRSEEKAKLFVIDICDIKFAFGKKRESFRKKRSASITYWNFAADILQHDWEKQVTVSKWLDWKMQFTNGAWSHSKQSIILCYTESHGTCTWLLGNNTVHS